MLWLYTEWALSAGTGFGQCSHGELEERDKEYLKKGSKAHITLRKLVFDKRGLLNKVPHLLIFR
jgi:hypothetical protein